jgi:hypothetical protein
MSSRVSHRARRHEDRGGDPLDGIVNLFDLGIVLAVGFLLAALSSAKLTPEVLSQNARERQVTVKPGESVAPIELAPGERVIGEGEEVGRVYRLSDGRTVLVRPTPTPTPTP